jgi:outer membrane protein insertion porin family
MGISEPRLFSTQIAASLVLFAEREAEFNKDFETLRSGATLGFSRKLTKKSIAGLSFSYEEKKKYEKDLQAGVWDVESEKELERRHIFVTTPSIVYDGRDSFVQPKKGTFSSLYIDISDGSGDGIDDFIKYRFDFRVFYTPFDRITFAWLSRFGYIDDLNRDNEIPEDQLFFLGGSSDVRGFDENMLRYSQDEDPIGGRGSIVESIEARLAVMRSFELSLFFDTGRVYKTYEEDDIKEFRSSAGFGLRYLTPVGPIGFCYGFKLDRKPDESSGRLHLSIGYTF